MNFRPEIEGLRAIAIVLIVSYHAALPGFSGGYIGVDVFFVLSGYLINGILAREIEQTNTLDILGFYARRARRLLPALALTLLATIVVSAAVYAPFQQVGFSASAISTAVYGSNLYFAKSGTDYFAAERAKNPFLHTWSLSVEEQFYLGWPLFVMFAMNAFSWQNRKHRKGRALSYMAAAVVASFAVSIFLTSHRPSWAYFISPARAWEFALGAIVSLLTQPQKCFRRRSGDRLQFMISKAVSLSGWAGLVGIGVASVLFDRSTVFPGFAALLPALSTALILHAAASDAGRPMVRMLGVQPLQKIGTLSYSWYLWHWPIILIGSEVLHSSWLPVRPIFAALSLGVAAISYRLIENPIRYNKTLSSGHAYSLAMAGVLAVVGAGLSFAWLQNSVQASNTPQQIRFTRAHDDWPAQLKGCIADYFDVDVKTCSFGAEQSPVTVVLFGDSHAAQWLPAIEEISQKRGWRLLTAIKSACAPVDAPLFYAQLGRVYYECAEWREKTLQKIRDIQPTLTLMTSSEGYQFSDAEWRTGISNVIGSLAEASRHVLVLRDNPRPDFDVPTCLATRLWRLDFIPSSPCLFPAPTRSKIYHYQELAARQKNNVATIDLSSSICPGSMCPPELNNIVVYRDSNHLTASFVRSLEGVLASQIDNLLAGKKPVEQQIPKALAINSFSSFPK